MGQLCGCARSQDKRGTRLKSTILTRVPSTCSSVYGPNVIVKHSQDGAAQRSRYSPGGATQDPPSKEKRTSRSHPNSLEDSGIFSKSSKSPSGIGQSTWSLTVHEGGGKSSKTPTCNGPINSHIRVLTSEESRSPSKLGQTALDKSSSSDSHVSSFLLDVTSNPPDNRKRSDSVEAEVVGRSSAGNDVSARLDAQAQKIRSVLQTTIELLAAEIDGCTLFEYLQRSRPGSDVTSADWDRCCSRSGAEDLFWDVITEQQDGDYETFCDVIESKPHFRHLLDLLRTLDSVVAMVTPELDDDGCHDDSCHDSNCRFESSDFDLDLVFCHRDPVPPSWTAAPAPQGPVGAARDDGSGASLAGSSYLPSSSSSACEDLGQPTVPMLCLSLVDYCLFGDGRRVQLLHRILGGSSCVRELSLVRPHVDPDNLRVLFRRLGGSPHLVRFDLRLAWIDDPAAEALGDVLRRDPSLRRLNVTGTGLSDAGCALLASGLFRNRTLSDLDVGFNDIRDSGCCSVAAILVRSNSLRRVRIRDNGITSYGASALFRSLARNCRLVFLDISSNDVGDSSLGFLAEALVSNRTLRELNLENCRVTASGCHALARALRANAALRCLQLSLNPVGDPGVEVLADGLLYNQSLETLSLNMCNVGNLGLVHLLETLRFNLTLTTVKLCYNNIGSSDVTSGGLLPFVDDVYVRLCDVLRHNRKLKVVLWGNDLDRIQEENLSSLEDPLHRSSYSGLASYSPVVDAYHRQDIGLLVSI